MRGVMGLTIKDEGFAFDPQNGRSFRVNPAACLILQAWQRGEGDDVVATTLTHTYGIPASTAERDVADLRACATRMGMA